MIVRIKHDPFSDAYADLVLVTFERLEPHVLDAMDTVAQVAQGRGWVRHTVRWSAKTRPVLVLVCTASDATHPWNLAAAIFVALEAEFPGAFTWLGEGSA